MEIVLTIAQWQYLKKIVAQGKRAETTLSKPVEVTNAKVGIEVETDAVTITLPD